MKSAEYPEPGAEQPLAGEPVARVLVAGATGYGGARAADRVWHHPDLELVTVTGREEADRNLRLDEVHPRHHVPLRLRRIEDVLDDESVAFDAAIVAYPHGAAAELVAELRSHEIEVVDLSADFRLRDLAEHEHWYSEHPAPELRGEAVYGLPELYRQRISGAELVANPGCYPTATLLALAPLAREGLIADVVVDAKSGMSGRGRAVDRDSSFMVANEDVIPYRVTGHRHRPEIGQELAALGYDGDLSFVPHTLPFDQGELVSCQVKPVREITQAELDELYAEAYAAEPFVKVVRGPIGVKAVRDTNYCHILPVVPGAGERIRIFATIDNLGKGAGDQAIQNLNLMRGVPETTGLV